MVLSDQVKFNNSLSAIKDNLAISDQLERKESSKTKREHN